jgi:predicted amidohydrolase
MMLKQLVFMLSAVCLTLLAADAKAEIEPNELVVNPTFASSKGKELPDGWSIWGPVCEKASCKVRPAPEGLLIEGTADPYAVGGVIQEIKGITAGRAYAVTAVCQLYNIAAPYRSVLVRMSWTAGDKLVHPAGMLVRGPIIEGELARFNDVLVVPDGANGARLSLELKWPKGGSVLFKSVSFCPTMAPAARKVKLGTVYLRPRNSTPEKNLKLWCEQIDAAGKLGLDVVCLGEAIAMVGTGRSVKDCAEPIPGPATTQLGDAARRNRIWVIAGLTELSGDVVYNTAILLDRQGQLAGKYRKVHLPREEWKEGIRPGDAYPVFETDFGKVAIQICYDWFFSEPAEIFALKGAEIIFAPTWGDTLPDEEGRVNGQTVFRVRARDNGVYMVPSVYDGDSLIIDPMGRIVACSRGKEGVFWAEVDLSKREPLPWVGYWRSIGPRHRMPQSYTCLLDASQEPTY